MANSVDYLANGLAHGISRTLQSYSRKQQFQPALVRIELPRNGGHRRKPGPPPVDLFQVNNLITTLQGNADMAPVDFDYHASADSTCNKDGG